MTHKFYIQKYLTVPTSIIFGLALTNLLGSVWTERAELRQHSWIWWVNWYCGIGVLLKFIYNDAVLAARLDGEERRRQNMPAAVPSGPLFSVRNVLEVVSKLIFIVAVGEFMTLIPHLYDPASDNLIKLIVVAFAIMAAGYIIPNVDLLYACRYDFTARPRAPQKSLWWIRRIWNVSIKAVRRRIAPSVQCTAERWLIINCGNIIILLALAIPVQNTSFRDRFSVVWWVFAITNVVVDLMINRKFFFGVELDMMASRSKDFSHLEAAFLAPFKEWVIRRTPSWSQVLEVGCGSGDLARDLALKCAKVLAIDNDQKKIEIATQRNSRRRCLPEFKEIDFFAFSEVHQTSELFDAVVATFVLHDFDFKKAVKEVKRYLKPNGRLLIVDIYEPNPRQPVQTAERIVHLESRDLDLFNEIFEGLPGIYLRQKWFRTLKKLYSHPKMIIHLKKDTRIESWDYYEKALREEFIDVLVKPLTNRVYAAQALCFATKRL